MNVQNFASPEKAQIKKDKVNLGIWVSKEFPLKFDNLLPIFEMISHDNEILKKFQEYTKQKEIN